MPTFFLQKKNFFSKLPFMKIVQESIFMNTLRAFFVSLFTVLGIFVALAFIFFFLYFLYSTGNQDKSSISNATILPDAQGNRKELASSTPVILQIDIDGKIGQDNLIGEKIQSILLKSREDDFENDRVKAILLVINSPGGCVNESDIIYRQLAEYKARYNVPIYAFVNGLCASGGYYIACAADKIYASPVSLIGSVGVLSWPPFVNVSDTLQKFGMNALTLSAGKGKDELNPFRPWKAGEQDHYQYLINYFYKQFVEIVSKSRPVSIQELTEKYGAEVFPGPKAKEYGLIDVRPS